MAKTKDTDPDKQIRELAIMTRNWARRIGAYIDQDTDHHGYFTIDEWKDEFEIKNKSIWTLVKRKIIAMGEPLAVADFGGHFWGRPGSQATTVIGMLKRTNTMIETISIHIEAMQASGQWQDCLFTLKDGLEQSRHDLTLNDLPKLMRGAGLKVDDALERKLLMDAGAYPEKAR